MPEAGPARPISREAPSRRWRIAHTYWYCAELDQLPMRPLRRWPSAHRLATEVAPPMRKAWVPVASSGKPARVSQ